MKGKGNISALLIILAGIISILPLAYILLSCEEKTDLFTVFPLIVYFILIAIYMNTSKKCVHSFASNPTALADIQSATLSDIPTPVAVIASSGSLLMFNKAFEDKFIVKHTKEDPYITDLMQIDMKTLYENNIVTVYNLREIYRVHAIKYDIEDETVMALYFKDDTAYVEAQNELRNTKPCVMLISIDNYSDALQGAKESEKTRISAEIEQLLDEFVGYDKNVVIFKTSNESFTVLMEEYNLRNIIAGKFRILDEARKLKTSSQNSITLSIGVSFDAPTLTDSLDLAKQSLDMALGRGGDQAAVKSDGGFRFFGGVSKGIEKKSRTKTRAVAKALKDLISRSEKVYIMGHAYSDLDSVGSACAMAAAVKRLGKESYVVIRRASTMAGDLVDKMQSCENPVTFVEPEQALRNLTDDTLLIIVDTHNKRILESFDLYSDAKQIAVIDHHRKIVDYIDNAVIFYHEPFASSASELVTEIIQYFEITPPIQPDYANGLLAGIMTDTKNFVMQTGVRTFEAAAYLKKIGADTVAVSSMFADSIANFRLRSKIISEADFINGCAVSVAGSSDISELKIIASQAADSLLTIKDVKASFVIYCMNNVVNISARSRGDINVQLLMEKLGGGGHQTMAAVQLEGITLTEAEEMLLKVIENIGKEEEQI
jgi:c-di-AMP phosphodiesterase-like protein